MASFIEKKYGFSKKDALICGEIGTSALQRSIRNNPSKDTSQYYIISTQLNINSSVLFPSPDKKRPKSLVNLKL